MSETLDRYRRVATAFTSRVEHTPIDAWARPTPCEGWVARDVVRHVAETTAFFLDRAGVAAPAGPSVDEDPLAAWAAAHDAMVAALDDPAVAEHEHDTPMGRGTLEGTVGFIGIGDLLMHTWDLSRATGQDEHLDPDEAHRVLERMLPMAEMMRKGGAFGPEVPVPDDADEQTRLIGFSGRQP